MEDTVEHRLALAWKTLSAAAPLPDREFWAAFDLVETATLADLEGDDWRRATQALHAYLGRLKGLDSMDKRPHDP